MASHQDIFGLVHPGSEARRPPVIGMQFLHERVMRPRNLISRSALLKSQDFISFIFRHNARLTRTQTPAARVGVTLTCVTPAGKAAVKISL